jgi:hypothetical protein
MKKRRLPVAAISAATSRAGRWFWLASWKAVMAQKSHLKLQPRANSTRVIFWYG